MKTKKRGQVSFYVIIGISLLLALTVSLVFFFTNRDDQTDVIVPEELSPAKNFIEYCADRSVQDALTLLGSQSGYLTVPLEFHANPDKRLSFGRGIELLPYWYYNGVTDIPTIESIEGNVSLFVEEAFADCMTEWVYSRSGFEVTFFEDRPEVTFTVNDEDVSVDIRYPLEISNPKYETKTKLTDFYYVYDVRLKEMMELGFEVLAYENSQMFFEEMTMKLMTMNEHIPFSNLEPQCGKREWHMSDIRAELQYALVKTLPEVRVNGTDYIPYIAPQGEYEDASELYDELQEAVGDVSLVDNFEGYQDYELAVDAAIFGVMKDAKPLPSDSFYYHNMFMDVPLSNSKYDTLSVDFLYDPAYGMEINAEPSRNGVLRSDSAAGFGQLLSFFCLNMYHFTYDVTYPLIIQINDIDAFKGDGYSFRFAIPILIRNNQGERTQQFISHNPNRPSYDDFCEEEGRSVFVKVTDGPVKDKKILDGVNLSVHCVNSRCDLPPIEEGDVLGRVTLSNSCGNPIVVAEKEGYMTQYYYVENNREQQLEIEMVPLKEFKVELSKHELNMLTNTTGPALPLSQGLVNVHFSGMVDGRPYQVTELFEFGEENTIELPISSTEYEVTLSYITSGQDYNGGFYGYWMPGIDDMKAHDTIRFHVIEVFTSTLEEEAAQQLGIIYDGDFDYLTPEFE